MKMNIENYTIHTNSGRSDDWLSIPEVTRVDAEVLDEIGYGTIKSYGPSPGGFEEYLNWKNSDNIGFKVIQTGFDRGDFSEEFLVTRVEIFT